MTKRRLSGIIMAVVGFIALILNAASYVFNWDIKSPALTVLGLVFVSIGSMNIRADKTKILK